MRLILGLVLVAGAGAGWMGGGWRARHHAAARLTALVGRVGMSPPAGPADLDAGLGRLTAAVDELAELAASQQDLARSLSGALEAMSLGVVVVDGRGEVLFRNESAAALVGSRPADVLASQAVTELLDAARGGEPASRSLELYGPPRRALALSAVPVEGRAGTVAVVVEDVSDRRRLDAVRRDFVANVSHELKTPVAALGLLAETLVAEDDIGVIRRLAERMTTESFRVARIIEDLLDLSRLEAEHVPTPEPVSVQAMVADAVEQVRVTAGLADVAVEVAPVPRAWTVVGDRRQLVSALANLLENAVKYSDPGSTVELGATTDGSRLDLVVADHGIGIPSRDLDRIFERFYRVDRGRSRQTGGTGLGLAIVRHVAANHGGDVVVSSREGEGSVFTLRLPAGPGTMGVVAEAG